LAITPFGTAAINAGLAKVTPPSSQTGAAVIPGHIGDQGGFPSGNFRDHRRTSSPGMKDGVVRNAIGVLMPPREATKGPDAGGRGFAPAGVDGTAKSTASAALKNLTGVGKPDPGRQISGPAPTVNTKANAPPVNTPLDHSVRALAIQVRAPV
jgi:hypothetical protein